MFEQIRIAGTSNIFVGTSKAMYRLIPLPMIVTDAILDQSLSRRLNGCLAQIRLVEYEVTK